ncbi:substrate-binding domain-containing protein [Kribbella rubisoli]|uniref:substrate-binding domain-containing protein n=1 Tax=Kribbella rubisoli TaxID=3075929 RepID=UPI00102B9556|nr:substrate-binding domain-containing protein [Kribbella rubisoli]
MSHLLELGHTRLAFLSGPSDSDTAERRRLGYIAAMNKAGLDPGFVAHGDYTADGGAAGMAADMVRMSLTGLGARAVELLLTRPRNEEIREVLQQPIDLIVRKSTARPST